MLRGGRRGGLFPEEALIGPEGKVMKAVEILGSVFSVTCTAALPTSSSGRSSSVFMSREGKCTRIRFC